jgi:ribosome recycling factor
MSKRNDYITKMKLQLDELNASMSKLETRAQAARDDALEVYKEEMRKLRHQSKLAVAKLDELKASSEDGWETMVAEMDKVRDAFTHSFHYFTSQLKS